MNNLQNQNISSKKRTVIKVVLVVIGLILVSGISYGSWKVFSKSESVDWKVYRNEKYKYQIEYPAKWNIDIRGEHANVTLIPPSLTYEDLLKQGPLAPPSMPFMQIIIIGGLGKFSNLQDLAVYTLESQRKHNPEGETWELDEVRVGGVEGPRIKGLSIDKNKIDSSVKTTIWLSQYSKYYQISYYATNKEYKKTFEKIVPSFAFTD